MTAIRGYVRANLEHFGMLNCNAIHKPYSEFGGKTPYAMM